MAREGDAMDLSKSQSEAPPGLVGAAALNTVFPFPPTPPQHQNAYALIWKRC